MNNMCMTGLSARTTDDGAAKSPLEVSMAAGTRRRVRSPLRPRGGAEAKLVPRADEIDDRSDLGALLTAATFALLPSAGES